MVVSPNVVPVELLNPLLIEGGDPQGTAVGAMTIGNELGSVNISARAIESSKPRKNV